MSRNRIGKIIALIVAAILLVPAQAMAHEGQVHLKVNGVVLDSAAIHSKGSTIYANVEVYTKLVGVSFTFDAKNQAVTVNGKALKVLVTNGKPFAPVRALATAAGAEKVSWDQHSQTAYVLDLPDGYIQLSPVVPGMGEHWANPQDLTQPVLGVYQGKLVFIEHIIPQAEFKAGKSWADVPFLKGKPAPAVDHADIEFLANGLPIPGLDGIPLYASHYYFVSHAEHLMFGMESHMQHGGTVEVKGFEVQSVEVVNAKTVNVKFSKTVADHTTNLEHKHFSIEHRDKDGKVLHYHNPTAVSLNVVKQTATLTVDPALHENVNLNLVIKDVMSADGQKIEPVDKVIKYVKSEEVSIKNFSFETPVLTVKKGSTVRWVNGDNAPHTVTASKGDFDSANMMPGDSWSYTFNNVGTFEYFCLYHPEMTAKVNVVE